MRDDRLKCRFCEWSTAKKYTRKDGKFSGVDRAYQRLSDHVELEHPSEWATLQDAMQDEPSLA